MPIYLFSCIKSSSSRTEYKSTIRRISTNRGLEKSLHEKKGKNILWMPITVTVTHRLLARSNSLFDFQNTLEL